MQSVWGASHQTERWKIVQGWKKTGWQGDREDRKRVRERERAQNRKRRNKFPLEFWSCSCEFSGRRSEAMKFAIVAELTGLGFLATVKWISQAFLWVEKQLLCSSTKSPLRWRAHWPPQASWKANPKASKWKAQLLLRHRLLWEMWVMSLSMHFFTVLVAFLTPPHPTPPFSVCSHPPIHPTVLFLFYLDPHYGSASHCKSKETLRLGCYGNMETVQAFEGSGL